MGKFQSGLILTANELNDLSSLISKLYDDFNVDLQQVALDKTNYMKDRPEMVSVRDNGYMSSSGGISDYNPSGETAKMQIITVQIPENAILVKIKKYDIVSGNLQCLFKDKNGKITEAFTGTDKTIENFEIPNNSTSVSFNIRTYLRDNVSVQFYVSSVYTVFGMRGSDIVDESIPMSKMDENWHEVFDPLMIDAISKRTINSNKMEFIENYVNKDLSLAIGPGSTTNPANYAHTFIEIPDNTTMIELLNYGVFSNYVALIYLTDDKSIISYVSENIPGYDVLEPKQFSDIPSEAKYICFNLRSSQINKVTCSFYVAGQKALNTSLFNSGGGGTVGGATENAIHELTVANSDKIAFIGDSYTESAYGIENKSYVAKISLFSDFEIVNFGLSGDVFAGRLYDIRRKKALYGSVTFDEYKPKYAMLVCYTNDIKYMNNQAFLKCTENIIKSLKGIGTIPIVSTEYHTGTGVNTTILRTGLRKLALEHDLLFFDAAEICDLTWDNHRHANFWGSSHPGSRANSLESDSYLEYLDNFERPLKSLKIFRARNANNIYYSDLNLDNYMFDTKYERAKIFKEINVGARGLKNPAEVDNVTNATGGIQNENSEYGLLMQGNAIEFDKIALISAILPYDNHNLKYVSLSFNAIAEGDDGEEQITPQVYIMNTMALPYPIPTRYSNFYVEKDDYDQLAVGDKLLCKEDNTEYTMQDKLLDSDGIYHIYCLPLDTSPSVRKGTLTRLSDNKNIEYTYREAGYMASVLDLDTNGHYTRVMPSLMKDYDISSLINGGIKIDQANFLIVYNGKFKLSDITVKYQGDVPKNIVLTKHIFKTNYVSDNEDLLPVNTFTSLGNLSTYGNVNISQTWEEVNLSYNAMPKGCKYMANLSDTNRLKYTVPSSKLKYGKHYVLEMWCRYFPDVYSETAENPITLDSFDYNEIYVKLHDNTFYTLYAGTHWKVLRLPIDVYYQTNMPIEIYSNNKKIELAYVSLKEV